MNLEEARNQFASLNKYIYMDVAARGIISNQTRNVIEHYLNDVQYNGGTKDKWFEQLENTRNKFAKLIHSSSDEVAYTKNVSEGLNIIANSFPWQPGDNIVICREIEHPNNVYLWMNLEKTRGIQIKYVQSQNGIVTAQDFLNAVDEKTRMISVSAISFVPGQRMNLKKIGNFCSENNIFFLVDAAQSCGILDMNVNELKIDALAVSSHKGILALYGMGFLYCRKYWIEKLHPIYLARYAVDLENSHEETIGDFNYQLHSSSKRFEIGNYNYLGSYAAGAALDLILKIGITNIETHVLNLSEQLIDGLETLNVNVSSGKAENLSNIVTIGDWGSGQHYMTDDPKLAKLYEYLRKHGVVISLRRGLIRFSLHLYNNKEDINKVLNLVESKYLKLH